MDLGVDCRSVRAMLRALSMGGVGVCVDCKREKENNGAKVT